MSEEAITMTPSAAARLREVIAERDRYRKTLEWIAGRESGIWGVEAHKALHPERYAEANDAS